MSSQNPTYFCNNNDDDDDNMRNIIGTNPFVMIGSSDVETININFSGAPVQRAVEAGEAPAMSIY